MKDIHGTAFQAVDFNEISRTMYLVGAGHARPATNRHGRYQTMGMALPACSLNVRIPTAAGLVSPMEKLLPNRLIGFLRPLTHGERSANIFFKIEPAITVGIA